MTRWPADGSRLSNSGAEGSPALSSSAASILHEDDGATERRISEMEDMVHPYLARQMSDLGFRQNPQGSNTGVHAEISSLPIYALAR